MSDLPIADEFTKREFTYTYGTGIWRCLKVDAAQDRFVEIYQSPSGRSVRIYVDGVEINRRVTEALDE